MGLAALAGRAAACATDKDKSHTITYFDVEAQEYAWMLQACGRFGYAPSRKLARLNARGPLQTCPAPRFVVRYAIKSCLIELRLDKIAHALASGFDRPLQICAGIPRP